LSIIRTEQVSVFARRETPKTKRNVAVWHSRLCPTGAHVMSRALERALYHAANGLLVLLCSVQFARLATHTDRCSIRCSSLSLCIGGLALLAQCVQSLGCELIEVGAAYCSRDADGWCARRSVWRRAAASRQRLLQGAAAVSSSDDEEDDDPAGCRCCSRLVLTVRLTVVLSLGLASFLAGFLWPLVFCCPVGWLYGAAALALVALSLGATFCVEIKSV